MSNLLFVNIFLELFWSSSLTRAAVLGGGNPGSSNEIADNNKTKEKEKEKKQPKGKSVARQAKEHISKGALKIVDADSLLEQLIQSNVQLDDAIVGQLPSGKNEPKSK